ncbi:MAG: SCO family protein [Planctomycetota bacterium]
MRTPWKIAAGVTWSIAVAVLVLWFVSGRSAAAEPERLFELEDFTLTTHTGETLDTAELEGTPWVAMIFLTECPTGACPMMVSRMHGLLEAIDDPRVRVVSIAADPVRDTPEQLAEYAKMIEADEERWIFATGSVEDVSAAAAKLFLVLEPQHDERFLLFDEKNRAVGTYFHGNQEEMDKLREDAAALVG